MVIRHTETIALADLEHSRAAREDALARAHDTVTRAVLDAAADDIELGFGESDASLTVSASLTTLNRQEFTALSALLRAHGKGYSATTLLPLLEDLARVFRR